MDFLDPIFNLHKIKFEQLDRWNLLDKSFTRANVYINLENVFKLILTPRTNNFIQAASSMDDSENYQRQVSLSLISNIINLGQHYRLWFTKHGYDSRIILYWNYPCTGTYKNMKYIPKYRMTHQKRYVKNIELSIIIECLDECYKFLKTCIQYIHEVYLVTSGEVESSVVPLLLDRKVYQPDGVPTKNFLVSNTKYEYPYVNYGFTILSPSIRKKQPLLITKQNAIGVLKEKSRVTSLLSVSPDYLEFINALIGDSDRDIRKLSGIGIVGILRMVNKAIEKGLLSEHTKDIDMLVSVLREDLQEVFLENYHCTNFEYQLKEVEPIEFHKIQECLIDKYEESTLREINERYFKLFPIEIIKPKSQQVLYGNELGGDSIFDRKSTSN